MLTRTFVAAVLALGLSQAAVAEGTSSSSSPQSSASASSSPENLPQELRQKLESAGYKNVKIVPAAFLVNAEDKDGRKVLMEISPTSMTVLAVAPASSTTGSSGTTDSK